MKIPVEVQFTARLFAPRPLTRFLGTTDVVSTTAVVCDDVRPTGRPVRGPNQKIGESVRINCIDISQHCDIMMVGVSMARKTDKKSRSAILPLAALQQAAECLKTLAHPVRLKMVQLMLRERYTVGELAEECEVPQNVASEHLRLMQRCGFLGREKEGRRTYYEVIEPHLESIMACVESRFGKR